MCYHIRLAYFYLDGSNRSVETLSLPKSLAVLHSFVSKGAIKSRPHMHTLVCIIFENKGTVSFVFESPSWLVVLEREKSWRNPNEWKSKCDAQRQRWNERAESVQGREKMNCEWYHEMSGIQSGCWKILIMMKGEGIIHFRMEI